MSGIDLCRSVQGTSYSKYACQFNWSFRASEYSGKIKDSNWTYFIDKVVSFLWFSSPQVSDASLTVGAGVSLTKLIALLQSNSSKSPSFSDMAQHVSKIANTPVRNMATWAGNVMLAYHHSDFPSDIFLLLTACNATLKIGMWKLYYKDITIKFIITNPTASLVDSSVVSTSLWDFLSKDMSKSVR